MQNIVTSRFGNFKYPVSDYVRVGMMGFVILMTIIMIKTVSLIERNLRRLKFGSTQFSLRSFTAANTIRRKSSGLSIRGISTYTSQGSISYLIFSTPVNGIIVVVRFFYNRTKGLYYVFFQ